MDDGEEEERGGD